MGERSSIESNTALWQKEPKELVKDSYVDISFLVKEYVVYQRVHYHIAKKKMKRTCQLNITEIWSSFVKRAWLKTVMLTNPSSSNWSLGTMNQQ